VKVFILGIGFLDLYIYLLAQIGLEKKVTIVVAASQIARLALSSA
jgi:hypothetical protein